MFMASSSGDSVPALPPMAALAQAQLRMHGQGDADRGEVERFIAGVFARRFGARVPAFAPILVSLRDPGNGVIVAAAGYRPARQGPLFLERYLTAPIESVLGGHTDVVLAREVVVEIGHLAASRAGAGQRLMMLLGPHLEQQGFRWVVGTLTQELRRLMLRLGITPLALARADPNALAEQAAAWGSYYEHGPVVLAGELRPALRRLARRLGVAKGVA